MAQGIPVGRPPVVELRNMHATYAATWYVCPQYRFPPADLAVQALAVSVDVGNASEADHEGASDTGQEPAVEASVETRGVNASSLYLETHLSGLPFAQLVDRAA